MVYKEICPPRLNFPYSAAQDGLQFLAVSRLTRHEFLSYLREISSIVLKLRSEECIENFIRWLRSNSDSPLIPLTELCIEGWLHYSGFGDSIAFCKVQHCILVCNSTKSLKFSYEVPLDHEQVWVYRKSLLVTELERTQFNCHAWKALSKLAKALSEGGRTCSTLQCTEIEFIAQTAANYLDINSIRSCAVKKIDAYLPRPIHYFFGKKFRIAPAVRQMTWKEWKSLTYANGDEIVSERESKQPVWTEREWGAVRALSY